MPKTVQKPHEAEEEYFARLEVEKKCKISEKKRAEMAQKEIESLKKIHARRCAECGQELETVVFKGIAVNKCFHCGGAYLGREAFQKLCGRDNHFMNLFMEIFQFQS
ncbi:MAG: zf-TFIIB domain-containing protein [Deltaproteobacteria bacterium]|nr:zf-TFIIB domain-containing protein [Deltaproteobacteria bacterium]MBI4224650.1 zf-TFIIB domain-containing protein [Deltaproteobacteria bacterium]